MVQFNLPDNSKLTDGDYYKSEKAMGILKNSKSTDGLLMTKKTQEWIHMKLI